MIKRRTFLATAGAALATAAADTPDSGAPALQPSLKVKFLGSGSACWEKEPRTSKIFRRYSSILVDGRFLIDFTWMTADMLPAGFVPEGIVYTHSHPDHYDAKAAVKLGVRHVYLQRGWLADAKADFAKAVEKVGGTAPEIHPLDVFKPFRLAGCEILPLPGNHWTGKLHEQALIYTVKKACAGGTVRLLYATDTSGLPAQAFFGGSMSRKHPITAAIMEATGQPGRPFDGLRISHSSADTVREIFTTWLKPGEPGKRSYTPNPGQKVWLTHIGYYEWGQNTFEDRLADGFAVAHDGLEVEFRPYGA